MRQVRYAALPREVEKMKVRHFAVGMLVLGAMIAAPVSQALASGSESIPQIGRNVAQKQAVISYLQKRIAKHQAMTTEQIIADLAASAEQYRQIVATQNPAAA